MMIKNKKRAGFTVIETLIAIFILEIALIGVITFYANSLKIVRIARNETVAANLAAGILDENLSVAYDNLPIGNGDKVRYSAIPTDPFYTWQKKIDISYIDINLNESVNPTNMKKIIVTVYWNEEATEKSFQTASIKAKH